jgi:hypothetical protein
MRAAHVAGWPVHDSLSDTLRFPLADGPGITSGASNPTRPAAGNDKGVLGLGRELHPHECGLLLVVRDTVASTAALWCGVKATA